MIKHFYKWLVVVLPLVSVHKSAQAQFNTADNLNEELFKYEVKVIDEFIERFNDDPNSFLRKEYKKEGKPFASRNQLLVTLFNLEKNWNNDPALKAFHASVLDKQAPQYLHFNDSNWYAEAQTSFTYNKKKVQIPLVLNIKTTENGGLKWMIVGVGNSPVLANSGTHASVADPNAVASTKHFLPTSAYSTNFIELHNIFSAKMDPVNYFDPSLLKTEKCRHFVELIKTGKLTFEHVTNLKFHFYQLPGWIFDVENFNRKQLNSGWLINSVQKVTSNEKEKSRSKLLGL